MTDKEWKKVSPYLLKEFYPLTPWRKGTDNTDFAAFCYYDAEREEGVILAFRQEKCQRERLRVVLPFAQEWNRYRIVDEDSGEELVVDGKLTLDFAAPRTAKLQWIKKM